MAVMLAWVTAPQCLGQLPIACIAFPSTYFLQVVATGKHVLGYVVVGSTALLLIAEKIRVSAVLPGNHQVKTVTVSKWLKIGLQVRRAGGQDHQDLSNGWLMGPGIKWLFSSPHAARARLNQQQQPGQGGASQGDRQAGHFPNRW